MKLSERWLRLHADPGGDTDSLVHRLTMQGLEVESVEPAAPDLSGVVSGRVEDLAGHPNADRLRVCRVNAGSVVHQVVCGAANVRVGGLYPLALPGARLPGGIVIRSSKLRGVQSDGMLCSAAELGLAERAEGLLELEADTEPGTPISQVLSLDDRILDLKITPNRADCFSVRGIARDLAAAAEVSFADVGIKAVPSAGNETVPVQVDSPGDCPVFATRVITSLRADAVTPLWLRERLRRSGIRAIHPVVDVTNYVMLELGQPMHAYDRGALSGGLVVRRGLQAERLELLSGDAIQLDPEVLVIADHSGPVALAGIMGGSPTAVTAATRDIVLESAYFRPETIAGRARRFGLQTDSATRFERGVDPQLQVHAIERATELLMAIAGGSLGPVAVVAGTPVPRPHVVLRRTRLAAMLGHVIADEQVTAIFHRLQLPAQVTPDGWSVKVPSFRFDIAIEADLIEEVGRIHGFDQVPEVPGRQATRLGHVQAGRVELDRIRLLLVERGFSEAVTYSFVGSAIDRAMAGGEAGVELLNPISAELGVMRQSLWPGLLLAVRHNLARQQRRVRLFEVGARFLCSSGEVSEAKCVAGVAIGPVYPEQWGLPAQDVGFFDLKSDVEALLRIGRGADQFRFEAGSHPALKPGASARIVHGGVTAGWMGQLHPRLVAELDLPATPVLFELDAAVIAQAHVPGYQPLSRFPSVRRDLAILCPRDLPVASLRMAAAEAAGPVLRELVVFDIFAGDRIEAGQKSVALGLILQETSRTLNDADVDRIVGGVADRLAKDFNAKIRE